MRICLVSSSFYPATLYGGPIFATLDLSKKLADKDIEIYVSTTNANKSSRLDVKSNKFIQHQENFFIKYYHEQILNRFSCAFILGIWADIKKSDVVYIQYLFHYTVLVSLLFSVMQNKYIIICPRGSFSSFTLSNKLSFIKFIWLRFLLKPFCPFINWHASSFLEEDDIKRSFSDARVAVINDGVDFQSFQGFREYKKNVLLEKFANIKCKDVTNIFFSMGRLHSIKRFDILIDAFSLFLKDDENAKLIIAGGDDGIEKSLMQQIVKLKIENSVFLIGAIGFEDKKTLLNNCDYFALASEFESFGIVIAEALSCGKPVLLSNKTPWVNLEKNKCGILVDNNKISFYNAFLQVTKEKYDSNVIKNYVKSYYDLSIIADKFLSNIKYK